MGFFDAVFGGGSSRAAAADTDAKMDEAIDFLRDNGNLFLRQMLRLAEGYWPYEQTGLQANDALAQLLRDPSSVRGLPGYQFAMDEGMGALDRSAASRGMLNSGRNMKDAMKFGTGLADQTYGSQLQRLMAGTGLGMQATAGRMGTAGQGYTGRLNTMNNAAGMMMQKAPVVGQGMVAEDASQRQGFNNILGLVGTLGGMGGGFGGFGAGGGGAMPNPMALQGRGIY